MATTENGRTMQEGPEHPLQPILPEWPSSLAEEEAGTEARRLRLALEASGVGIWSFIDGQLEWDDQLCRLFDVAETPADYEAYLELIHPDDREAIDRVLRRALRGDRYRDVEHRVIRQDGSILWILGRGLTVRRSNGEVAGLLGIAIDITGLKRTQEALWRAKQEAEALTRRLRDLSATDGLTGIANRRRLDEHLDIEWRRAARIGQPIAIVIADIDHFKAFNDLYGHLAGDDCLRRIAAALTAAGRRATDLAGRYGGEEFLLVMSATDEDEAFARAEHLRQAVADLAIPHAGSPGGEFVSISCGVAVSRPTAGADEEELIAAADLALYEAKAQGRDRVRLYPPSAAETG